MPDLPSWTVTFLFTDLAESTRLWEDFPEAMRAALAPRRDPRHDGRTLTPDDATALALDALALVAEPG